MSRCAVLLACALMSCVTPRGLSSTPSPVAVGSTISLKLASYPTGEMLDLAKERGKVVLLDVWASYCEPCKQTLPLYEKLLERYHDRGFAVYAVNEDESATSIPKFLSENSIHLPVLLDPGSNVAESYLGVKVMPTTFLIDRHGVVRRIHEGSLDNTSAEMERYQNELEPLLLEPR